MKTFLKKYWCFVLLVIMGLVGCIINITLSFIVKNNSNIFTAVSGWVSGIATIILGIIAVWQNKQYKSQNDKTRLLNDLKREVDLIDELYFKYIQSCDSAILIFNAQRLYRQDSDVYFDNIIKFQIELSKIIGLIYNKINTMGFYIKSDLNKLLQEYYDTVDEKINKWQKFKFIDSTDLNKISESFHKTSTEFINYNAEIGKFYNSSLRKTSDQLQVEIENMILERNKHIRYKIQKRNEVYTNE